MKNTRHAASSMLIVGVLGLGALASTVILGACSDDSVGHSKSVTKTTTDTPAEKTTTTVTHQKDTTIDPNK